MKLLISKSSWNSIDKYKIHKRHKIPGIFIIILLTFGLAYGEDVKPGQSAPVQISEPSKAEIATEKNLHTAKRTLDGSDLENSLIFHDALVNNKEKSLGGILRKAHNGHKAASTVPSVSAELGRKFEEFLPRQRGSFLAARLVIRNTSELHVDSHNRDRDDEELDIPRIPSSEYDKKVVVLQKPFHFHIPIFSSLLHRPVVSQKKRSGVDTISRQGFTYVVRPRKKPARMFLRKRDDDSDEDISLSTGYDDEVVTPVQDTVQVVAVRVPKESFRSNHRTLIDRRRSSKNDRNPLADYESGALIGVPLVPLEGLDSDRVVVSKRALHRTPFSQTKVTKMLGHEDDWVKYKHKIKKYAKSLGKEPELVFRQVVDGTLEGGGEGHKLSTKDDIYQRRLQFHRLFLDDSDEVEKYHVNEVAQEDRKNKYPKRPFNTYMKVLKRSKRGLKSWLKKVFKGDSKQDQPEGLNNAEVTNQAEHEESKPSVDLAESKAQPSDDHVPFKQQVNAEGDTAVDKLLPTGLRRSTAIASGIGKKKRGSKHIHPEGHVHKRKTEHNHNHKRSRPPAPVSDSGSTSESGSSSDSTSESGSDSDSDERKKKKRNKDKKKRGDKIEVNENKLETAAKSETSLPKSEPAAEQTLAVVKTEVDAEPKATPEVKKERRRRRSVESYGKLSKDEMLVVFEMMINMVEFQCGKMKGEAVERLLKVTQDIVGMSQLQEWIPRRRRGVDELFQQMLECSSNKEKLGRWMSIRKRQGGDQKLIGDAVKWAQGMVDDRPLRRMKRVRREEELTGEAEKGEENFRKIVRLYYFMYQVISDNCFNMENTLLREAIMIFAEELGKLRDDPVLVSIIDEFAAQFNFKETESLITRCYEPRV